MRLLGRTGKLRGQTHAINGPTRIGRGPENELAILVEGVSRRHARIVPDEAGFWLEDLDSSNGTMLNGQRVKRERLEHLDVISLGRGADLIVDIKRSDTTTTTSRMARPATIYLEALDGPQEGSRIDVRPGEISIGRTAPATLLVENPAVSKVHARLRRTANTVVLEDFQSSNGTFVNSDKVSGPVTLKDGDRISIAGLRTFKISIAGAPDVTVAPAAVPVAQGEADRPKEAFDQEWRTKLVWSPDELAALDAARVGGSGKTAPRPSPAASPDVPAPVAPTAPIETPAARPAATAEPAAPKTQLYGGLPLPPPVPGHGTPAAPRAAVPAAPPGAPAEDAPKTQHFESLPLPPPVMPPRSASTPRPPAPPASSDEPKTQQYQSIPDAPPIPVRRPPAPAAPPTPPSPAGDPKTQHFDNLPEAPPLPVRRPPAAPAPPTPRPPAAASPPPPSEAPTQHFDSLKLPPTPVSSRAPAMRAVRLRGATGEFLLKEGQHQVGRQESCPVAVLDRQVSRNHAMITVTSTSVGIEDQKSANGTTVNGKRISAPTPLKPGDKVAFGGIEFTIEVLGQG